jgi:hypothetical protein
MLTSAERGLFAPTARRDVLSSQWVGVSEEYSRLQDEYARLQASVLGSARGDGTDVALMRENKQIYADLETLSAEYERTRLDALSPIEKEHLAE